MVFLFLGASLCDHERMSRTLSSLSCGVALVLCGCNDDVSPMSGSSTVMITSVTTADTTSSGSSGAPTTSGTSTSTSTTSGSSSSSSTDATSTGSTSEGSSSTGAPVCPEDKLICEGGVAKVCDGLGGFKSEEMCPEVCAEPLGCVACDPDSSQCAGEVSQKCKPDGSGWVDDESCDPLQGVMCDAMSGKCAGPCSSASLGTSYIGCDYYPVTLSNLHETQPWTFYYAVVVANTTDQPATVTVTRGANMVTQQMVGPNTAKVIQLPYENQLVRPTIDNTGPSLVVADGAYRLRSNQPVTVYQYEPLDYVSGNLFSYTNDASLLLPVNSWTGDYVVASRNHWVANGQYHLVGWYAVVASKDDTKVTLVPSATGKNVFAGGGVATNGTGVVTLNEGDVLEVFTASIGVNNPNPSDLTGTMIQADKPVEVFGGHKCTQVPIGIQACDRLEEAMPPIETLAKKYIVTPPLIPTGGNTPKGQMVRVIATEANTTISYDPPQGNAPTMLANAGDYFEIPSTANDFEISADKRILVAQYMQGQDAGGGSGDPAMALAVATEQYRSKYLVHAPTNYETNYINITAPMGAMVTLDGAAVGGFVPIGATGFGVARVKLNNNGDGNHELTGDQPFGVSVYGYGQYTSYWYPGGLDLKILPG